MLGLGKKIGGNAVTRRAACGQVIKTSVGPAGMSIAQSLETMRLAAVT